MSNLNILVTGNGFDLAHGMKTSYRNFVEYTKDNNIGADNGFIKYFQEKLEASGDEERKWIDCEAEIAQVVKTFSKVV